MDVSKRFKKGMNIGIDPSYFAVKQGNMGFWFIKYYQVLYQLFSTAFDQHEIQLRASFMSNLREISQRAVVKRLFAKSRKRWWCVTCHCIKVFGFSREILKVS
jgi:RNase P subunit RPR2